MKTILILIAVFSCMSASAGDIYSQIFQSVDQARLTSTLKEIGASERYSPTGKENFRKYWKNFYKNLGVTPVEMTYPSKHNSGGEKDGHNVEAIFPGQSADSVVIIVHYDSIGPDGAEATNPGVDDDMTGMGVQLETARILAQYPEASPTKYKDHLQYTVRFVAADYEEWGALEGARVYAKYLKDLSEKQGFKIIAAIDDEQSGWNCVTGGKCKDHSTTPKLLINDCSKSGEYSSKELSGNFQNVIHEFSSMPVVTECSGQDSDHYAMWEIGVPAVEFGEFSWETNDHFDSSGGDTMDKIDLDYYFSIARLGVVFAAQTVGINL